MDLDGAVVLVTGASRGVGAATAVALADAGAVVACAARATDVHPQRIEGTIDATVRRIESRGGRALGIPTDLADEEQVRAMVRTVQERLGRVDALMNNAAITFPGDVDMTKRHFDAMMAVDVRAPMIASSEVIPGMVERGAGAILNVSSAAGLNPIPGLMVYGMAKAALEFFTVSLAVAQRRSGVAVNAFRIDVPVASEGFVANAPDLPRDDWEPCEVAAEGIVWMLSQPATYTGRLASVSALRRDHGIMASRASKPFVPRGRFVADSPLDGLLG